MICKKVWWVMGNNIEKNSNKQIKLGALMSYIAIAINIISGLIYTPWMVQIIGKSDYGLYSLASSFIAIFMMDFGISSAVSRFVSKFLAEGNKKAVNNFLGIVYKLYIVIDIAILVVLTVLFFFLGKIYIELTALEVEKFKILYIIVGLSNLISFPFVTLNGLMTSYEKFFQLKLCNIIHKLFIVICTIAALLCGMGVYALVTINALANVLIIFVKLYILKSKSGVSVNFKYKDNALMKEIFVFSGWATVLSIAQRLVYNITPSILGIVSGSIAITLFSLASTLEGFVFTISDAINGLFLPKVSRIVTGENKQGSIMQLMIKVGRINMMIISLVIIGFVCAGKEFITLWMGEDYITVYYITILLIIPTLISAPQQIANTQLIAENKIKFNAVISLISNLINVAISFVICRYIGALGAGISICIAMLLRIVSMNIVYKKIINIDILRFFKECTLKLFPALLLYFVCGIAIFSFIAPTGWSYFILKTSLLGIVYFVIIYFLGMNKYEKDLIFSTVKSIRRKK